MNIETVRRITASVAEEHAVEYDMMMSERRWPHLVHARWDLWYRLWSLGASYHDVGRIVGRDHKAVMYGVKQWQARAANDNNRSIGQVLADNINKRLGALSKRDLARRSGYSLRLIRDVTNGHQQNPRLMFVADIANVLGCTTAELLL